MTDNYSFKSFTQGDSHNKRRGRPRKFDLARYYAQPIAQELVPYGPGGRMITSVEAILRDWATSDEFKKQLAFVQYGFGKPPKNEVADKQDVNIVVNWDNVVTRESLARQKLIDSNPDDDASHPVTDLY